MPLGVISALPNAAWEYGALRVYLRFLFDHTTLEWNEMSLLQKTKTKKKNERKKERTKERKNERKKRESKSRRILRFVCQNYPQ